jgi:hypothetical protein
MEGEFMMAAVSDEQALKAQNMLKTYCSQNTGCIGCIFKGGMLEPCIISSGKDPAEWPSVEK